jgi:hypothetical protein
MPPNPNSKKNPLTLQELDSLDGQIERELRQTEAVLRDLNAQQSRLFRNRSIVRNARENLDVFDRDRLNELLASETPPSPS